MTAAPIETFVEWMLRSSLQATVVIALVLIAQAVFRRWLPPRWTYLLWFLVVARLVLPVAPESRWSVFNWTRDWTSAASREGDGGRAGEAGAEAETVWLALDAEVDVDAGGDAVFAIGAPALAELTFVGEVAEPGSAGDSTAGGSGAGDSVAGDSVAGGGAAMPEPVPVPLARRFADGVAAMAPWLAAVWLAGFAWIAGRRLRDAMRFRRCLRRAVPCEDRRARRVLDASRRALGVRRPVELLEGPASSSPALAGVVRPRLLVPRGLTRELRRSELALVFLHELVHLKRKDLLVNAMLSLLEAVHWFNPAVRFASKRCRSDQEIACDDAVLAGVKPSRRARYGLAILKVVERMAGARALPGAVALLRGINETERRIHMITDYRRPTRTASLFGLGLVLALGCVALSGAVTVDAEACPPEKAEKTEKSGSCCGGDAPELTIASPDAGDGKGTIGWVMKPSGKEGGGFVFRRADGGDAGSGGGSGEKKIEKRFEFRVGGDGAKGGAGKKGDAKTFVWRSDGNSGVWLEGDGGEPGGMWRSADGDTFEIELPDIDVDFDVDLPEFDFTEMDFDLPEFDFTEMDVDGTYDVIIADGSGNEPKVFRGKLGDGEMAIGKAFGGAIGLGGGKGGVKIEGLPGLRSGGRSGSKVGGGSSSGGCPHCKHCNRATPGSKNEKVEIIRLGDGNFTFEGLPGGGDMLRKKVIRLRGDGDVHLDHDVELDHDVDIQVHGEILDGDGNRFHVLRPGGGGSIGSAGSGTGSHVIRLRGEGLGGGGSGGGGKKGTAVYEIRGQGGGGGGAAGGKKSGTYRYEIRTDGQGGGGTCVPKSDGEHRVIRLGDDVEGEVRVEVLVSPESPESGNRVLRVPEGKAGNKKFEIRLKGDGEEIHDVILEPGSGTPKVKKRVRRDLRTL